MGNPGLIKSVVSDPDRLRLAIDPPNRFVQLLANFR